MKKKSNSTKDIFSAIKKDHRLVESLFKKIQGAKKTEDRLRFYEMLQTALSHHAEAEEAVLYPRLKEKEETRDIAFESAEEHDVMKHLMGRIDGIDSDNREEWEAACIVLKEVVRHHVEEEEKVMFPKMRRAFTKQERQELYVEFQNAKEGLLGALKRMVA